MAASPQQATPTNISASGATVSMVFTAPDPNGSGSFSFTVTTPYVDDQGQPKSPATLTAELRAVARAVYLQKFPNQPVAPALPAAFGIN